MRTTLFALASGFALTLSTAAFADVTTPEPQHVMPAVATTTADAQKITCHHLVHEGTLSPIVQCGNAATWTRTRLETERRFREFQNRSLTERPR